MILLESDIIRILNIGIKISSFHIKKKKTRIDYLIIIIVKLNQSQNFNLLKFIKIRNFSCHLVFETYRNH